MTGDPLRNGDAATAAIEVRDLTMSYDAHVIMQDLTFRVERGEVFVIMGGSGGGKSTLLKHLIGLKKPAQGSIRFQGEDFIGADMMARRRVLRRMGVLYQNGALWSGLTLAENVALPLEEFTELDAGAIGEVGPWRMALRMARTIGSSASAEAMTHWHSSARESWTPWRARIASWR
jgi:phospholipid/cholesterol/gamma-HCH transport system ATP-binding protein